MSSRATSPPFFIVGVPRSGTTLLSVLLNGHSRLFLDKQAIAIRTLDFYRRVERSNRHNPGARPPVRWKDEAARDERLVDFLNWPLLTENTDLTLGNFVERSFAARAATHGKEIFGDKSPDAVTRLPELLSLFPNAQVIVVVRDARPNVLSLVRRQYLPLRVAAQRWKDWNAAAFAAREWLGPDRIHTLRYEDLLREPETTLRAVCSFLGVGYEPALLDLAAAPATRGSDAYVQPTLDPAATERWKTNVAPADRALIERSCGHWLMKLDYEVSPASAGNEELGFWADYRLRVANAFRLVFRPKRKLMRDRRLQTVRVPLSERLYVLLATVAGGLLRKELLDEYRRD